MWRNGTSYIATLLLPHLKSQTRTPLCFLSSTGAIKTVKRNFSHSYWLSFMLQKTSHSPRWSKCRCPEAFRSMLWKILYWKLETNTFGLVSPIWDVLPAAATELRWCCYTDLLLGGHWDVFFLPEVVAQIWLDPLGCFWGCWTPFIENFFRKIHFFML